ncbi:MAG TPA: uridine kinase [Chthoniobacteraceae bacterium]|jgi:uridine kinase|nr:uridine kinase [Chthoniobacteraceae bacterium]
MNTHRIIGIAGGTGSGKTWLGNFLASRLGPRAALISHDWYYRDRGNARGEAERKLNFDHPRALETGMLAGHLDALRRGRAVETPRYDFSSHRRARRTVAFHPAPIVIVEGLFVLHEKPLLRRLDLSIYVDVPADVRLLRRLRRDAAERAIPTEETLRLYETFARPMHERFVETSAGCAHHIWRPLRDRDFPRRILREIQQLIPS